MNSEFSIESQLCFDNSYLAPKFFILNDSLHELYLDTAKKVPLDSISILLRNESNQDISEYPLMQVLIPNITQNEANEISFPKGSILGFVSPGDTSILRQFLNEGKKLKVLDSNIHFEFKSSIQIDSYLTIIGFNENNNRKKIDSTDYKFHIKKTAFVKTSDPILAAAQKIAKLDNYILYIQISKSFIENKSESTRAVIFKFDSLVSTISFDPSLINQNIELITLNRNQAEIISTYFNLELDNK